MFPHSILSSITTKNYKMKTLRISILSFLFIAIATFASAQTKTEKINVSGECGMCKSKIEKAAKTAGASFADWDVDAKVLTVKYNSTSTNTAKIEQAVASVGYDTKNIKATEESYNKLHGCCKYERNATAESKQTCCKHESCHQTDCMKDGKCDKDMSCCKEAACDKKDCCKKA